MKRFLYLFLTCLPALTLSAEVYKCKAGGNSTVYQAEPCAPAARQKVIEVEAQTPEQREQSEAQLREWQNKQALEEAEKATQAQKAQEAQQELAKQQAEQQRLLQQQRAIDAQQQPSGINRRFGYMPNPR